MNQHQNNDPPKPRYPVILIVGRAGSGKSTLGNMLLGRPHNNGPFKTSDYMSAVTTKCQTETITIEGERYTIVDTPGFFDSEADEAEEAEKVEEAEKAVEAKKAEEEKAQVEIFNYILLLCTNGIKAILIVFESTRFTIEQKKTLDAMQEFFGKDALKNYAIIVFSKTTKDKMNYPAEMELAWNKRFTEFIKFLDNRWGISPNSDYFDSNHQVHRTLLENIKEKISHTPGVYSTEEFKKVREQYDIRQRQRQEERKLAEKERKENERKIGHDEAKIIYDAQLKEIKEKDNSTIALIYVGIGSLALAAFLKTIYDHEKFRKKISFKDRKKISFRSSEDCEISVIRESSLFFEEYKTYTS